MEHLAQEESLGFSPLDSYLLQSTHRANHYLRLQNLELEEEKEVVEGVLCAESPEGLILGSSENVVLPRTLNQIHPNLLYQVHALPRMRICSPLPNRVNPLRSQTDGELLLRLDFFFKADLAL